ncbi:hypothetical protein Patl1_09991 [Pistacia atlantica]|uniref:Uncharacterized protein n=1 Tax=Pistacia atlantica TaxID=434234 RepID=A0ACC1A3U7_9ROSI|nr:hypothetical protein Patl1_09991 [Pistacia atlantica]
MASLQASSHLFSSSSSPLNRINAAISVPKLPRISFSPLKKPITDLVEQLRIRENENANSIPAQLYAILEAVADRVEMHNNIGQQRDNWNILLLNSINMISLIAATMAGVAATGAPLGLMVIVNKIQPSQLAEEQRNATRLFKQLQREIQTVLALRVPSEDEAKEAMEKVLALDQADPLPLLGKMIEKFPKTFEPAVW